MKILIGFVGAEKRCGCTHAALTAANYLKNRNLKTALVEYNESGAFEEIQYTSGQELNAANNFVYNNIDFYPYANEFIMSSIMNRPYQFVIVDFGSYKDCDKMMLAKCDVKIVVCGSKPWEVTALESIFENVREETLKEWNFFFTFATENEQTKKDIITGMGQLKNVFFTEYTENPFLRESFPGAESILGNAVEGPNQPSARNRFFPKKKTSEMKNDNAASGPVLMNEPAMTRDESQAFATPPKPDKSNATVNTLLGDDTEDEPKKGLFGKLMAGKKKPEYVEVEEEEQVAKNLAYTKQSASELLLTAKDLMKTVRNLDIPDASKSTANILSFRIFQNAFCAVLRSGELHTRATSVDGYPTINVVVSNQNVSCNEDRLVQILGEHDSTLINPYEDTYEPL